MKRRVLLCAAGWLCGLLALVTAGHAAESLPPTEAFARLPQVSQVALSPDGTWFAAVMNRGDNSVAVARPVDGQAPARALLQTDNREFRLAWVHWVSDERLVISLHYPDQRSQTETVESRLVVVNRDGSHLLSLDQPSGFIAGGARSQFQDQVVDWLPGDGHHILLQASNSRHDTSPSVFRVDIDTGRREAVHGRSFGVRHWLADGNHRVRVGVRQLGTQIEVVFCDPDGEHWRTAWSYELFDRAAVEPLGFGADPNLLYVNADHDGRRAVYEVDLRDPNLPLKLMLAFAEHDAGGALVLAPGGQAVGIRSGRFGDAAASYWDPATQALARAIDDALPGRANRLLQFSADGARYLLYSSGNGLPGQYLVGDRANARLSLLARQYPELPPGGTARKQAMTITARDGLKLPAYLTLPDGVAPEKLPTVLLPHGGPISQDSLDFDPLAAFLASRGYAVLQVNFRGSAGLGADFVDAGLQRWGLEMQDDLTDALQWLVARGTADPARVCIVGGSYGGYAALMGGAKTPELYRCVVSLAGISDLLAMASHQARYVNGKAVFDRQVGSVFDDRQRLKDTSPVRLAERFRAPVLLVHGTEDRTVPFAQSQAMADALAAAGKPVSLVTLEGGDHQLSYQAHRLQFYQALERFLGEQLAAPAAH